MGARTVLDRQEFLESGVGRGWILPHMQRQRFVRHQQHGRRRARRRLIALRVRLASSFFSRASSPSSTTSRAFLALSSLYLIILKLSLQSCLASPSSRSRDNPRRLAARPPYTAFGPFASNAPLHLWLGIACAGYIGRFSRARE
mmetsp:Transcript_3742/g.14356  ORF Transcript_3742/g.14356 Transcript_3742/m.14356 type:complete len:144 (-) Transcript_3742:213-644(-)